MSRSRAFANVLIALVFAAIFIFLGFWQLDRAAQVKELQKPFQELPIVDLAEVSTPSSNLSGEAVNRIVEFSGGYVAQYLAPNQMDNKSKADWNVALMEVDGGGLILVVRGEGSIELPRGEISVRGRIYHRQFEDVAPLATLSSGQLRRSIPHFCLQNILEIITTVTSLLSMKREMVGRLPNLVEYLQNLLSPPSLATTGNISLMSLFGGSWQA